MVVCLSSFFSERKPEPTEQQSGSAVKETPELIHKAHKRLNKAAKRQYARQVESARVRF
jgi:hypothetical protein